MRDLRQRPEEVGSAATRTDIDQWRAELEEFLLDQADDETRARLEAKTSDKWQRLATYDLICATDWQLVVLSGFGLNMCSKFHEHFQITNTWNKTKRNSVTNEFFEIIIS